MSEFLENDIKIENLSTLETKTNKKNMGIFIIMGITLIIAIGTLILMINENNALNQRIKIIEDNIISLDTLTNESLTRLKDNIEEQEIINNYNGIELNRLLLSQVVDDGIVNDQFFIVKSRFYNDVAYIDVDTQPIMDSQYKGRGNFSTEDRELKKYLIHLMDELETTYIDYKDVSMAQFQNLEIHLTIKNYDIGIYKNGVITLSGD